MPLDRSFAQALADVFIANGWQYVLPDGNLPNPLLMKLISKGKISQILLYARKMTPQANQGENPSTHNRPIGEFHTQMIFDGDKRGAGQKNQLHFEENVQTVLFGFRETDEGYVIAAYEPDRHKVYGYSKSLQMKQSSIDAALKNGIAFQTRSTGETIVVFHIRELFQYLEFAEAFHHVILLTHQDVSPEEELPSVVRQVLQEVTLPILVAEDRQKVITEVGRYLRNRQFREGIKRLYPQCAICEFQYDHLIDAAHIVPVADGGTDTYDNGIGLCPTCHRMFDKGFILIDEHYQIYLNPHYAEMYDQLGIASSLNRLQSTFRQYLWMPADKQYQPSPENLRKTFETHRLEN